MPRNHLIVSFVLPMVLSFAPLQQASAIPLTPDQSSLIDATCTKVMGLRKGESYFAECQDSLAHSMARKTAAAASVSAYGTCRSQNLAEGSAAFSVCVLNAQDRMAASVPMQAQPVDLASADNVLENGKSYYSVTPTVQWQRERYSCAQLGLAPNSGLFGTCVASLSGALFPDPN
jgi:hypothetical protein